MTLADTGCKGKVGGTVSSRNYQDCAEWRFPKIITSIAELDRTVATAPDLIIHAGDYRYFWEPIRQDPAPSPDTWSYWLRDFFQPAQPALLKAAWGFSRGNHEMCGAWYGTGWAYLMGTGEATDCDNLFLVKPWSFDVAPGGIGDNGQARDAHRFVMIDTSKSWKSAEVRQNFVTAIGMSNVSSVWWVTHIPGISLLHFGGVTHKGDTDVRTALEHALSDVGYVFCDAARTPSCRPSTFLMGHQHLLQQIAFFRDSDPTKTFVWPQQYIVGNGGVRPDRSGLYASPCSYDFRFHDYDVNALDLAGIVWSESAHGYVDWVRSSATSTENSGWVATPMFADGTKMPLSPASKNPSSCR